MEDSLKDFLSKSENIEKYSINDNKELFITGYNIGYSEANKWHDPEELLPDEYRLINFKNSDGWTYIGIYTTEKEYGNWFNYTEPDIDFWIKEKIKCWKYV